MIRGRAIVAGAAGGPLLVCDEPLSFWGGYDQTTGEIIDRRHPLSGCRGAGAVLAIPFTRGSSTSTAILLEAVRAGVAPAAVLAREVDPFLALASVVAGEMYDRSFPVVVLDAAGYAALAGGTEATVRPDGTVVIR